MHFNEEDIEKAVQGFNEINLREHRRYVRLLMRLARPGNWAFRELENTYGLVGDYLDSDAGEPPRGANW